MWLFMSMVSFMLSILVRIPQDTLLKCVTSHLHALPPTQQNTKGILNLVEKVGYCTLTKWNITLMFCCHIFLVVVATF